jgi:hypothetical protein
MMLLAKDRLTESLSGSRVVSGREHNETPHERSAAD